MTYPAGVPVTLAQMAAVTPQLLQSTYLTVASAGVTLTIPSGFNRVHVFWRTRGSAAATAMQLQLQMNNDSASNYLWERTEANNATTSAANSGGLSSFIQIATMGGASITANYMSSGEFTVDGVSDTSLYATALGISTMFNTTSDCWSGRFAGQHNVAGATTSLQLKPSSGNFVAGSSFSMYGYQ